MNAKTKTAKTPDGRKLKPHDGSEWYVCRECGYQTDPAGENDAAKLSQEDADEAKCAECGSTDTAWVYAD